MRRMLFAAALALLGFAATAWGDGPVIRWASIVGVQKGVDVEPDGSQVVKPKDVATIRPVGVWNATVGGRVMLNLATGFIAIDVEGFSLVENSGLSVLGAPYDHVRMAGTMVCQPYGDYQIVNSHPFWIEEGDGHYRGLVDNQEALQSCRDRPDQTVFLLRRVNDAGIHGFTYHAYGIGRTIQSIE